MGGAAGLVAMTLYRYATLRILAMVPTPRANTINQQERLRRMTVNPEVFGGKPIIRGRRLAVEQVLGMLAAGDRPDTLLAGYPWPEPEANKGGLACARRRVGHERFAPGVVASGA